MPHTLAALMRSTEAIERALESGDEVSLATALDARRESFEALREQRGTPLSAKCRDSFARVAEADARIVARATALRDLVRAELLELRDTRRHLRSLESGAVEARFVNRHA